MAHDYFETVTALDSERDKAVKRAAGVRTAEEPAATSKPTKEQKKAKSAQAVEDLEKQMSELHAKGRALMSAGKHNTPEYDDLVVKNKHLRRKRDFLTDHGDE